MATLSESILSEQTVKQSQSVSLCLLYSSYSLYGEKNVLYNKVGNYFYMNHLIINHCTISLKIDKLAKYKLYTIHETGYLSYSQSIFSIKISAFKPGHITRV